MRQWVIAIMRDLRYLFKTIFLYFVTGVDLFYPFAYNDGHTIGGIPIILVHGSSGNQTEWIEAEPYIKDLLKTHPTFAFSLDLNPVEDTGIIIQPQGHLGFWEIKQIAHKNDWTIEQYSEKLHTCVNYVKMVYGFNKVILIGHSLGGLISAHYETVHPDMVEKVVMICSPIRGAPILSRWPISYLKKDKRGLQMMCGSNFLQNLVTTVSKRPEKYMTIGSNTDIYVPNENSYLNHNHTAFIGYGHFSIVSCEKMWRDISDFIEEPARVLNY